MRALVLDAGATVGALAAVRQLAQAGWEVGVGSPGPTSLARWTRWTDEWHRVPAVQDGPDAFLDAVARASSGYDVVLCVGDAEAIVLSENGDRVPAVVPYAEGGVRRAFDKLELARAAERVGVPSPWTVPVTEEALAAAPWPCVVKARLHWVPEHGQAPSRHEVELCAGPEEARRHAAVLREEGAEPLLQAVLPGEPVNTHVLADRGGEVVAVVQTEAPSLFFPPGAGRRVRAHVVPTEPEIDGHVRTLLRELEWFGLVGVTFMRAADGTPHVMDFNGRVPASADVSGPTLVPAWAALAVGRAPDLRLPVPGTRWQHLESDLRRAVRERRGGLARDVAGTLRYAVGARHTILRADEPQLAVRWAAHLVSRAVRKRRG